MEAGMDVAKLLNAKLNRRQLLGNLGMMGAGAVMTACGGTVVGQIGQDPQQREGANFDAAILNFALNLEYLEAAFYLAAIGRLNELPGFEPGKVQLPDGYTGTDPMNSLYAPEFTPSTPTKISGLVSAYAQEIAQDELDHVVYLRTALASFGLPVAELPVINLSTSFVAAATAAAGFAPAGLPFDPNDFNPFANDLFFLHGAFIFEDVGVTAYKGAARFLTDKDVLEDAAGILAVEAYHAGMVRSFLFASDRRFENRYGTDIFPIVQAISDARDALDGPMDLDQGIFGDPKTNAQANVVPTDENAIAFSRTPLQVAQIVQLNPDAANLEVSFFPEGLGIPAELAGDFATLLDPDFPRNL
jgi:hypothetical protein